MHQFLTNDQKASIIWGTLTLYPVVLRQWPLRDARSYRKIRHLVDTRIRRLLSLRKHQAREIAVSYQHSDRKNI